MLHTSVQSWFSFLYLHFSIILLSGSLNVVVNCYVRARTLEYIFYATDFNLMLMLQNRAQAATELLQELNSDVSGNFVEEVSMLPF